MPRINSVNDLTKEDVLQIWSMRAGGKTNKEISEHMDCPYWLASDVIVRNSGPSVPIPPKIKEAALKTVVRKPKTSRSRSVSEVESAPPPDLSSVVPDFFAACLARERARVQCIEAGVTEDTLALLIEAAKEQAKAKH